MKRLLFSAVMPILLTGIITGAGKDVGKIASIDAGKKEIIINVKSGTNLKMGDLLEIQTGNGKIVLDVTFPMMTTSKCKIKGKAQLSALSKGMTVYRYIKEIENTDKADKTGKAGEMKKFGGIEMIKLPGGTFKMGSPESEELRIKYETQHEVTVDCFWIGRYEVTQKEYIEIMEENPSTFKGENLPVNMVNRKNAIEFCEKFSKKYDVKARLPYEAEWEYACRGGTSTRYYWGNEINGDYCWYIANSDKTTHPVGLKKPNAFGLYDMSGNVWEWCMDRYDEDYYQNSPPKNPEGARSGSEYVLRGGNWNGDIGLVRSSFRNWSNEGSPHNTFGFRIVISE